MATVVIIGGGVSGLSAGIYALLGGHHAIICERHVRAGGNLTGWQRGEYHIDNCIHWLTGTNPSTDTYRMWNDLGALGDVKIYQSERLYTCEHNGKEISLHRDLEHLRRDMLELSPTDKKETECFISAVRLMQGISGIGGEGHNERISPMTLIAYSPLLLKYYNMSTGELASRFKHPLISKFFSSLMGNGFGAIALINVFACFCGENGGIPRGGSVAMAERMSNRFIQLGGELLTGKAVVRINYANGSAHSVTLSDGRNIPSDYVVMTGEPSVMFKSLLGVDMPRNIQKEYDNPRKIRFSSIQSAFSCDSADLPFDSDYIFEIPFRDRHLLRGKHLVLRGFAHEPTFSPSGKNLIQALTFCSEKDAMRLIDMREKNEGYREKKREIAQVTKRIIEEKFPMLTDKIECLDVWTPATYHRYTDSEMGSYMSFILPSRTFLHRIDSKVEGFDNLFLATQWQMAPGGLPIAAECGKRASERICRIEAAKTAREKGRKRAYVRL